MTKRTRAFFLVAGGILVVGLGTGLVASYMGLQNFGLLGRDGPPELAYVPADARMLAYANVRDVMDSELRSVITRMQPQTPDGSERFEQETGIDVERDVDYLVMAVSGDEAEAGQRPLVLARGRFDTVRIEAFVRDHGALVEEYRDVRLLNHAEQNVALAFVEPGLVAVGSLAAVRRAIDTEAGGGTVRDNADLMQHVRSVDDGNAWAVARFDALTGSPGMPADLARQLPPIGWFSASGFVNGGVRGVLYAEARDEQAATDLREVLRGFVALARLQVGQRAELADLVNSLELGGQGATVSLGFNVPAAMIEAIGAGTIRPPADGGPDQAPAPDPPGLPSL